MDLLESIERNLWLIVPAVVAAIIGLLAWVLISRGAFGRKYWRSENDTAVGIVTRLKADYSGTAKLEDIIKSNAIKTQDGWLSPEIQVCNDCKGAYDTLNNKVWIENRSPKNAEEYLNAANEMDRKPGPLWLWGLWLVMVILESYAFNLLLADYVTLGGTPQQAFYAAWALSGLFSILFVFLAEWAGFSQYIYSLAYYAYKNCSNKADFKSSISVTIATNSADEKTADKKTQTEGAIRILNRSKQVAMCVPGVGGSVRAISPVLISVVIFLGLVMIGIYAFRVYDLANKEAEEVTRMKRVERAQDSAQESRKAGGLPADLRAAQEKADSQADAEQHGDKRKAFYLAFGMFSFLFLGLQAVGILMGYRYGFASNEGARAYGIRKDAGFMSDAQFRAECARYKRETAGFAQHTLGTIQQLMATMVKKENLILEADSKTALEEANGRTFLSYLQKNPAEDPPSDELEYIIPGDPKPLEQGRVGKVELVRKIAYNEIAVDKLLVRRVGVGGWFTWHEFIALEKKETT